MKERTAIRETEDELRLPTTADTLEGMETSDDSGLTEDEAASIEDEVAILDAKRMSRKKKGRLGKDSAKKSGTAGEGYYRKALNELLPYLLAVLILLAMTQTVVGVLWSRQERRLENICQRYGEEYGQE